MTGRGGGPVSGGALQLVIHKLNTAGAGELHSLVKEGSSPRAPENPNAEQKRPGRRNFLWSTAAYGHKCSHAPSQ